MALSLTSKRSGAQALTESWRAGLQPAERSKGDEAMGS
jgi:hypothetical protein